MKDNFCTYCLARDTALFTLTEYEEKKVAVSTGGQFHVVFVAGSDVCCLPCRLTLTSNHLIDGSDIPLWTPAQREQWSLRTWHERHGLSAVPVARVYPLLREAGQIAKDPPKGGGGGMS